MQNFNHVLHAGEGSGADLPCCGHKGKSELQKEAVAIENAMHELYSCTLARPPVRQLQPVSFLGPSNGVKTKLSGHSVAKRQTLVVSLVTTKHFPPTILKLIRKDEEVAF